MAINGDCSPAGSTRAWRKLREEVAATLPQPCGQDCGRLVMPGDEWVLGHLVDRVNGGTVADGVRPEHRACSDASGGRLAHERRYGTAARAASRPARPGVTLASSPCKGSISGQAGRCPECTAMGARCTGRGAYPPRPGWGWGQPPSRSW